MVLEGGSLDGTAPAGDREAKLKMHIKTVSTAAAAMHRDDIELKAFYDATQDLLLPYLDSLHFFFIYSEYN